MLCWSKREGLKVLHGDSYTHVTVWKSSLVVCVSPYLRNRKCQLLLLNRIVTNDSLALNPPWLQQFLVVLIGKHYLRYLALKGPAMALYVFVALKEKSRNWVLSCSITNIHLFPRSLSAASEQWCQIYVNYIVNDLIN